ncbi:MAG: two-component regulator propeller domain-containing protein [Pseudomonadota bacterium]
MFSSFIFCKYWANWLVCILSLFVCVSVHASSPRNLQFEHLSVANGMPQESVNTILQDRQGFIWIGTQAGLTRFDGYRFKVYKSKPLDPESLIDNYILSSYEDSQGGLWFGTKGGLNHFDTQTQKFTRYIPDEVMGGAPANRTVAAIAKKGPNSIWLATEDGLKYFDFASHQFGVHRHDPANKESIRSDKVNAIINDSQGNLWVGTSSGLELLRPKQSKFEHINIDIKGRSIDKQNKVLSLSLSPPLSPPLSQENILWIGTDSGLSSLKINGSEKPVVQSCDEEGLGSLAVQTLYHDQNGNLWIGTITNGLKLRELSTGKISSYRTQVLDRNSLANNEVRAIFQDRTGVLWVGTWFNGISKVDLKSGGFEKLVQTSGEEFSLSENKVRAITTDEQGRYWLGTIGGGLNRYDPKSGKIEVWVHQDKEKYSLLDNRISALAYDKNKRLLVGTRSGLSWFDPATNRLYPIRLGETVEENYVQYVFTDSSGTSWVASKGGLHKFSNDFSRIKTYRHDKGDASSLVENSIFSIAEENENTLWIGTENGLDRMDKTSGKFNHYQHITTDKNSLLHNRVNYLFRDSKGVMWIGTAGGLDKIVVHKNDGIQFQSFAASQGGATESIGAILEDNDGKIWFSSIAGVSRLDPSTEQIQLYTSKDGLIEGSYFISAGHKAKDGTLSFGGLNGLTLFQSSAIHNNPHAPAVFITDFSIFNQSINNLIERKDLGVSGGIENTKVLTLTYLDSVFSIEFSALHYADPQRNHYAYQLLGFDKQWVETDASKRFATYTNLDPGQYTFKVKASNKDGIWNEDGAALTIVVTPPFWKTWWFRITFAMMLSVCIYLTYQLRVRSFVQQKQKLEQEVASRTNELLVKNRQIEQQKESVELAHRNMSMLSEIGREITTKLDTEAIIMMVYRYVQEFMDASVFGIGFYRAEKQIIEYPFAIEGGKRYSAYSRDMRDPNQFGVWCITHQKDVFINDLEQEYARYFDHLDLTTGTDHLPILADGTMPCAAGSMLYVPISVNGHVHSVISVHSHQKNAYEAIHLDILRTLASYVGVAFDNADAYRSLKDTQQQLVEQGKLAALGSLVAGVAHELNTPIGNSLMIASTMQEKTDVISKQFKNATVRRSDLANFIDSAKEASEIIMRGLKTAANLINSFKQVAVDQTSAKRRQFNLLKTSQEIVATMMNQVRKAGHTLTIDIPEDIEMDSYPGSYGQVIINFISNVLLHAFDDGSKGHIHLSAIVLANEKIEIQFKDNGAGIKAEDLAHIFDPFFTTKLGQGGSGLGLNISYNIVTSLLEGQIRVESMSGQGTTFFLELPLKVSTKHELPSYLN